MASFAQLLYVPLLIALNAFFVAAEYALVALRPSQVEELRRRGAALSAAAMARMKEDLSSAIGAIQVCITLTNLLLGWLGEPAMTRLLRAIFSPLDARVPDDVLRPVSITVSFLVVTLLTVVLSELVPKALTLQHTLAVARLTAPPMRQIMRAIRPLVWIMDVTANATTRLLGLGPVQIEGQVHSAEEIRLITAEAGEAGVLSLRERSIILNALALGRRTAEQIMVPRVRVAYLDLRRSMEQNIAVMSEYLYSRLPLCDGGMDRIVGVIYTKEFLTAYQEEKADSTVLSLIARPAVFVPASVPLDRLLTVFKDKRTHMVFLVDEYGGLEGLVTVTDVVDELLGEMAEGPLEAAAAAPQPGAPRVLRGDLSLHEVAAMLRRDGWGADEDVNTIGGLLTARLGHVPRPGEETVVDGVRLRVVDSTRRHVRKVRVDLVREPPRDPGG